MPNIKTLILWCPKCKVMGKHNILKKIESNIEFIEKYTAFNINERKGRFEAIRLMEMKSKHPIYFVKCNNCGHQGEARINELHKDNYGNDS